MIATYVDVDPDGDVQAILSEPIGSFAPTVQVEQPQLPDADGDSNRPTTDKSNDIENLADAAKDADAVADIESDVLQATPPTEFRLRLSSKHLMLASPRLHKMYSGDWNEATDRDQDGLLSWRVDDFFDPDVFIIVMNVVHGRNRNVPRDVDLELLAKIAVATDYLQCHESMEVLSGIWMNGLKSSLPDTYCRELILWIMISSIFRDQDAFSSVTRTAILRSGEEVPSRGLPIREDIINEIENQRQDLLDQVLGPLYNAVNLLRTEHCGPACDAIHLGSLIKQMKAVDLLQPRPSRPVHGVSVATVVEAIANLSFPAWYHPYEVKKKMKKKAAKRSSQGSVPASELVIFGPVPEPEVPEYNGDEPQLDVRREGHPCTLGELLHKVEGLEAGVRGLDLEVIYSRNL